TALQRRARGEGGNLRACDFVLRFQIRHFVLERFLAIAEMIQLKRQVNVAETGKREETGKDNPACKRRCVNFIPISSRSAHAIFSATRNFALRERGFVRRSFSPGSTGLSVIARRSKSGFRRGSGHSGLSIHSRL